MKKLAKLFGLIFLVILLDCGVRVIPQINQVTSLGTLIGNILFYFFAFIFHVGWVYLVAVKVFILFSFLLPNKKMAFIFLGSIIAVLAYVLHAITFSLELEKSQTYTSAIVYPIIGSLFGLFFYNIFKKDLKPA
jgi:hypothetical protein